MHAETTLAVLYAPWCPFCQAMEDGFQAGAYTCPLFSSTRAVSDTKYILNTPSYLLMPPKHPLNNP